MDYSILIHNFLLPEKPKSDVYYFPSSGYGQEMVTPGTLARVIPRMEFFEKQVYIPWKWGTKMIFVC